MRRLALAAALAAALPAALTGCGTRVPPAEPVLALSRTDCDPRPYFPAALPVRLEDRGGTPAELGGGLGAAGSCLVVPNGAPTTYAVFALPPGGVPYTLEILSRAAPRTIVRPVATLYDAAGQVVRTVPPEEFEANIAGLRAGVRPRGTERWLAVAADQSRLGQTLPLRMGGIVPPVEVAAVIIVPLIIPPPPDVPDLVRQRSPVISLNGTVVAIAAPVRSVNAAP